MNKKYYGIWWKSVKRDVFNLKHKAIKVSHLTVYEKVGFGDTALLKILSN